MPRRKRKSLTLEKTCEIREWVKESSGGFLSHYEDQAITWVDKDPAFISASEILPVVVVKENGLGNFLNHEDESRLGVVTDTGYGPFSFMWCGEVSGYDY